MKSQMPKKFCNCEQCQALQKKVELTGKVVISGNPEYNDAKENLVQLYQSNPFAIVFVQNDVDVKNAISFARQNQISVRIRSGRSSLQGYCGKDNCITIDVSEMKNMSIDFKFKTITFEAGITCAELTNYLTNSGFYTLTCDVGSQAGFVLGGGLNLFTRMKGIACQLITNCKIVVGNGKYNAKTIICNAKNQFSDLFFGIKGAGNQNFGVVTELTMQIFDQPSTIATWTHTFPADNFLETYNAWQTFATSCDLRLSSCCKCFHDHIEINGIFIGDTTTLQDLLHPLQNLEHGELTMRELPFNEYYQISNRRELQPCLKYSSIFTQKLFPLKALTIIQYFLSRAPNSHSYFSTLPIGPSKKKNTSCFAYDKCMTFNQIVAEWSQPELTSQALNWVQNFRVAMLPYLKGSYSNTPCGEIANFELEYYGHHVKRLQQIKNKYDPYNTFHSEQSLAIKQ